MKGYKVINFRTAEEAEKTMNEMADNGWVVVSSIPSKDHNYVMIVTFERDKYNF